MNIKKILKRFSKKAKAVPKDRFSSVGEKVIQSVEVFVGIFDLGGKKPGDFQKIEGKGSRKVPEEPGGKDGKGRFSGDVAVVISRRKMAVEKSAEKLFKRRFVTEKRFFRRGFRFVQNFGPTVIHPFQIIEQGGTVFERGLGQGNAEKGKDGLLPVEERMGTVLRQGKRFLPQGEDRFGLFVRRRFVAVILIEKGQRFGFREDEPGGFLTAETETDLGDPRKEIPETGVVPADLAEDLRSFGKDKVAKAVAVKEGTALFFIEDKMGAAFLGKGSTKTVPQFTAEGTVAGKGLLVHVDLPADAAAVTALSGQAVKRRIVVGIDFQKNDASFFGILCFYLTPFGGKSKKKGEKL